MLPQHAVETKLTDLIRDKGTEPDLKFGKGVLISRSCAARAGGPVLIAT